MANETLNFTINLNGNAYKGVLQLNDVLEELVFAVFVGFRFFVNRNINVMNLMSLITEGRYIQAIKRIIVLIIIRPFFTPFFTENHKKRNNKRIKKEFAYKADKSYCK